MVTSYTLFRLDFDVFDAVDVGRADSRRGAVRQEPEAKAHQCARRLGAPFKLAITGTPMENNLVELWSMLSITAPGLFPKTEAIHRVLPQARSKAEPHPDALAAAPSHEAVDVAANKDQVATDLPPKQEQVVPVDAGAQHQAMYDTRLAREPRNPWSAGNWERNRFEIFRSLTMLRQLVCMRAGRPGEA